MNGIHFKALDTNSKTIGLFQRMTFGEALTLTEAEVSEINKAIATIESGADKLLSLFRQAEQRYELKTDKSTQPEVRRHRTGKRCPDCRGASGKGNAKAEQLRDLR